MQKFAKSIAVIMLLVGGFALQSRAQDGGPVACGSERALETKQAGASVPSGAPNASLACAAANILLQTNLIAGGPGCAECAIPEACFPDVTGLQDNGLSSSSFFDPATGTWGCTVKYKGSYKYKCSKCK